ncbi:MAG: hypothetical protein AAGF85_04890 [Bacteroidota bacterium]
MCENRSARHGEVAAKSNEVIERSQGFDVVPGQVQGMGFTVFVRHRCITTALLLLSDKRIALKRKMDDLNFITPVTKPVDQSVAGLGHAAALGRVVFRKPKQPKRH